MFQPLRPTALTIALLATLTPLSPTPPVAATVPPPPGGRWLIGWTPGEVRCEGAAVTAQAIRRPWNYLGWGPTNTRSGLTLRFAIDSEGRAISITRQDTTYAAFSDDVAPALAASRFAAGAPHQDCTVTYAIRESALTEADPVELMSYTMHPLSGVLPRAGWDRLRPAESNCLDTPYPQPLIRHFPDFKAIAATPGVQDWSMVRYDLDRHGKPTGAAILTGTGNAALDQASLSAVRASRFTKGARTGCLYPYHRAPGKLPAPAMPEMIRDTKVEGNCPDHHPWATTPQLRFPEAYRRRSIEGWAVVSYDVAPWGELGNLKVIAAQPSSDFGQQAISVLRSARFPAGGQGYTGCVDRVRFNMGPATMPHGDGDGAPPPIY
ncbi:TonB family protein [Sphingomonadaceae bacterium jetA1]|jgi:TonB family protein|uniref:TonB family protein n=1 Tax=Facivitalis istanbulensis TaxID=3075838 RepID=UPI0034829B17